MKNLRQLLRRTSWLAVFLSAVIAVILMSTAVFGDSDRLMVGLKGEPVTLDFHWTSDNLVRNIGCHIFETLFAFNEDWEAVPMLVESYEKSEDGLTTTYHLRQGVVFHDGSEMTSADVVASLNRWLVKAQFGRQVAGFTDTLVATDEYTVTWKTTEPLTLLERALSSWRQGAAIYPKSIVDKFGENVVSEYIGTGPYKFVRWNEGQSILLEKFDEYVPVDLPADGYSGKRVAEFEELEFIFVPEEAVRRLGVETGDFQVGLDVSRDSFAQYEADPNISSIVGAPRMSFAVLNKRMGPLADLTLRRALQAAICVEEVLPVYGAERFWRADPGVIWLETAYWTDAGGELYNVCDPEWAERLIGHSDYDGTPLRFALNPEDVTKTAVATVMQQQLEEIGVPVVLEMRDIASHSETIQNDPAAWDLHMVEATYRTHPILVSHLQESYRGWWENGEKDALLDIMLTAKTFEESFAAWERIQELDYEDVCIIKLGDFFEYHIASSELDLDLVMPDPFFWNCEYK